MQLHWDGQDDKHLGRKALVEWAMRVTLGPCVQLLGAEHLRLLGEGTEPSPSARPAPVQIPMLQSLGCSISGRLSGKKGRSCSEEGRDMLPFSYTSKGNAEPSGELLVIQTGFLRRTSSEVTFVSVQ